MGPVLAGEMAGRLPLASISYDTTRASFNAREAAVGETTMVEPSILPRSNFQRAFQGTGKPRQAKGDDVVQALVAISEELVVPIFDDPSMSAKDRRNGYVDKTDMVPASWAAGAAGVGGAAPAVAVVGEVLLAKHVRKKVELAKIVEQACIEGEKIANDFSLDEPHGAAKLYTSGTTIVADEKWTINSIFASSSTEIRRSTENRKFYKAINKIIADDDLPRLKAALPFLRSFNFYIDMRPHDGGIVYSGVSVNKKTQQSLLKQGNRIRIPRYLSTSSERKIASLTTHCRDLSDTVGKLLLVIHIPPGFHGARDIAHISKFAEEKETIFTPYAHFVVKEVNLCRDPPEVELIAIAAPPTQVSKLAKTGGGSGLLLIALGVAVASATYFLL